MTPVSAASLGFEMDKQMVERQLRLAEEHLQRRKDRDDEIVRLTNTLEMTTRLVCMLRAQLADMQKSRDDWREEAQMARDLLAQQRTAPMDAATSSKH
jgi:hypothetical protein